MRKIERTLRKGANTPHTEHNKEKVEGHMLEIKQILGTLTSLSSPFDQNLGVGEHAPHMMPRETATISVSKSCMFLASPSLILCENLTVPQFSTSKIVACKRLFKREFTPHEFPSLIEAIFSSNDEGEVIRSLPEEDAQAFIDAIDEARFTFSRYYESVKRN